MVTFCNPEIWYNDHLNTVGSLSLDTLYALRFTLFKKKRAKNPLRFTLFKKKRAKNPLRFTLFVKSVPKTAKNPFYTFKNTV